MSTIKMAGRHHVALFKANDVNWYSDIDDSNDEPQPLSDDFQEIEVPEFRSDIITNSAENIELLSSVLGLDIILEDPIQAGQNKECSFETVENELQYQQLDEPPKEPGDSFKTITKTQQHQPPDPGNSVLTPKEPANRLNQKKVNIKKRILNNGEWMVNKRKKACNSGVQYINRQNKVIQAKTVTRQNHNCRYNCCFKINETEQNKINEDFYSITQEEKHMYLISTTKVTECKRGGNKENSKKKQSFSYFFRVEDESVRVCKSFFLGTLHISQKMIYHAHKNKDPVTGTPKRDNRGKSTKERLSDGKTFIREHISSFPAVESHYCRAKTNKRYLESSLNINKLYSLYKKKCTEAGKTPLKESMYRNIFNTEYNISFQKPKTDRCDVCEEYKIKRKTNTLTEEDETLEKQHITRKIEMRAERNSDKNVDNNTAVICFDLQNVINCPKVEIGSFFYKRKLNVYNLTAHVCFNGKVEVYCVIWTECHAGRGGNEIASSLYRILVDVVSKNPSIKKIITWSDSCVPQNRNSFMASAVLIFLREHENIEYIEMKYSVPGHSCIQEVDNIHSQLEKCFRLSEFCSPLSLIRLILRANEKHPFTVIQLKSIDVKNFQKSAQNLLFKKVPFFKLVSMKLGRGSMLSYRVSYGETAMIVDVDLCDSRTRKRQKNKELDIPQAKSLQLMAMNKDKKSDIETMLKFMPLDDRKYMQSLLNIK